MTDFLQLIASLREQMHATLSRSDVLKPLGWLIGIEFTGTLLLALAKVPDWLLIGAGVALLSGLGLYSFAFIFCLCVDRDALRSERYVIDKIKQ